MEEIMKYIIYNKSVCLIKDILKNYSNNQDYYLLVPLTDNPLNIKIPTNSKLLRQLITKEEALNLIKKIKDIPLVENNPKNMETLYKELFSKNDHESLIKIIKTTYLRNKERLDNKKKVTDKDTYYFNLAERYLYEELQIALNLTYEETKNFVISTVNKLSK